MTTGERIKEARKRAGMTQKELADKLGVQFQNISSLERDERNPKLETLQRIAQVLGVSALSLNPPLNYWIDKDGVEHTEEMYDPGTYAKAMGYSFSGVEGDLIASFSQLNPTGQQKAVERVEELTEIPKYQRTASTAASTPSGEGNYTPAQETPAERKETPPQADAQDGEE